MAKLLERVVTTRLLDHCLEQDLLDENQSAYKKCHSTVTALVKVQNDLLSAIDNGGAAMLVLLDCSAAFDTVDHHESLQTLEENFSRDQ